MTDFIKIILSLEGSRSKLAQKEDKVASKSDIYRSLTHKVCVSQELTAVRLIEKYRMA